MVETIAVLGGSGYVGKNCIFKILKNFPNIKVISFSRSGRTNMQEYFKYLNPSDIDRIENVSGSVTSKSDLEGIVGRTDAIIHSVGTLLSLKESSHEESYDSKSRKPVDYCIEILKEKKLNKKINFVYISAERGLPLPLSLAFGGYIESKKRAEQSLLNSKDVLNPTILKPGIICHPEQRSWSVPLYHSVNFLNSVVEKGILSKINSNIGETLQLPSQGTMLETLSDYAVKGAVGALNQEVFSAEELI